VVEEGRKGGRMGEVYRQITLMTMIVMVRVKRLAMPRAKQRIMDRMPSLRGYLVSRMVPYSFKQ
jgi:hypothetical protein